MDELTPPKESIEDQRHKFSKGILGIFPGGSLFAEFYDDFFGSPIKQRAAEFLSQVALRIKELERKLDLQLSENDKFLDVLYQATSVARTTSNADKLNAIINLIVHAAMNPCIDEAIESLVIRKLADCSGAQLVILQRMADINDGSVGKTLVIPEFQQDPQKWQAIRNDMEYMHLFSGEADGLSDVARLMLKRIKPH